MPLVERSAIHLNFGRLAMSVAGLVEDPAVASFDDEKIPGAQEILTRARGDVGSQDTHKNQHSY